MAKSRRQSKPAPKSTGAPRPNHPPPWHKRAWLVISIIGAGLIWLLANGLTILTNAEKLPTEAERVYGEFLSWHHDDKEWQGVWSAYSDGYIDFSEMDVSDVDYILYLQAEHGVIDGAFSTKTICKTVPMLDYLLLEGKTDGDTASITAYDFIDGKRINFFRFIAKREGLAMTLTLKEGA